MSMDAYNNYMTLIQQGVPQFEAYQQSGLGQMAAQWDEQRRQQAIEQEKLIASQAGRAGRQQLGGQLAGALATKGAVNLATTGSLMGASTTAPVVAGTTGAVTGGTVAGTTGAVTAGTTGAVTAGTTGAVTGGAAAGGGMAGAAMIAAPILAAIVAGHQARQGYKQGKGHDVEDAIKKAKKDPMSWIIPAKGLGMIAGSVFGGGRSERENFQMTSELLDMGFKPKDLQILGRLDEEGGAQFMKTTKEQQNEWKRLTSSKDPDVNPEQLPTGMWGAGGLLKTFGPDYFDNMNEFDRYVASAAAIQTDQIYSKRGELKVENKDLVKQRYEELKNDPEQLAILQNNYNQWLETGKDTGLSFDGAIRNFVPPPPPEQIPNEQGVQ